MSEKRSRIHAANTTDWRALDFLTLVKPVQGYRADEFKAHDGKTFEQVEIDKMPNRSLFQQARQTPLPTLTATPAATPVAPPAPTESALPAATALPPVAGHDASELQRLRQQAYDEGFQAGLAEGEQSARARLASQARQDEHQAQGQLRVLLQATAAAVNALQADPTPLHEPLKRLALRLAEELVLGELHLSTAAIDRLVQRCVDALDAQAARQLVIELSPDDWRLLKQHPDAEADRPDGWVWQANDTLLPGSVRVHMDQAVITDLIEHRLQTLAGQLLGADRPWSGQGSAFQPERLAERRRQSSAIEDTLPRMTTGLEGLNDPPPPAWAHAEDTLHANETGDEHAEF